MSYVLKNSSNFFISQNDTKHSNRNGLKEVDIQGLEARPLKRSKPITKKLIPNKIIKPNEAKPDEGSSPPPTLIENNVPTNVLVEPDILEPIKPKEEPPEEPDDIGNFSEHSLEIDMSSMVDTSMGESSSMGDQSQSSLCWKADTKTYVSSDPNAPGKSRIVLFISSTYYVYRYLYKINMEIIKITRSLIVNII